MKALPTPLFIPAIILLVSIVNTVAQRETLISDYEGRFKEKTNSVPTNSDQVCGADYSHDYEHIVFIDPTKRNSTDCNPQQFSSQSTMTCSDLNTALYFHADSTAYVLASGANVTHYLKQDTGDSLTFFSGLSNVGFFGHSGTELARIECLDNAGLAFWNTNQVKLQNIYSSRTVEPCARAQVRILPSQTFT